MIRDIIKDEIYFNKYISYQNGKIDKFENILAQKSLDTTKLQQCNEYLVNYKLDLIKAKYSSGADFDEIKQIFLSLIENAKNSNKLIYSIAVEVLSMSVIFDYSDVLDIYDRVSDKDDITNFLYEYSSNKKLINVNSCLFEDVFLEFIAVIKNNSDDLLIKYMKDDWYQNNINTSWYDSHNLSSESYSGYWSFLSIAIIKILAFDVSKFKNVRFVPIELLIIQQIIS